MKDFEAIAKEGVPIAQAISDYRSDHGVLPQDLNDVVPAYLPKRPKYWDYYEGSLDHFSCLPHTDICFDFDGDAAQWRLIGEYASNVTLNVPGPASKKPAIPVIRKSE